MMTIPLWRNFSNCTLMVGTCYVFIQNMYICRLSEFDYNLCWLMLYLYPDSGKKKTAVVQWFVRMCEIPQNKRKLLGRDPHPQEVFFYQDRSYENEVEGETILAAVQVQAHIFMTVNVHHISTINKIVYACVVV